MKISLKDIELKIFKYLWVFILLPKELQFALYIAILVYLVSKKGLKFDTFAKLVLMFILIDFVAIFSQVITGKPENSRLFAAFNTAAIWGVAIIFYCYFREKTNSTKGYLHILSKYAAVNFFILFLVWCVSLVISKNTISIDGLTYYLRRNDFLSTGTTTRFCGLMDTLLCPSHFYIIQMPIIFLDCVINNVKTKTFLLVGLIGIIPVIDTHSRAGLVICILLYAMASFYLIKNRAHSKKVVQGIYLLSAICLFAIAIVMIPEIKNFINGFINGRTGSNNTRLSIYINSIRTTWESSPIIGMGIKYMMGKYPLGSHSTYIGIFYKTGIIGSVIFVLSFFNLYSKLYRNLIKLRCGRTIFAMLLCYLPFLIFADLDATDWIIVCFFSICGILLNPYFNLNLVEDNVNEIT